MVKNDFRYSHLDSNTNPIIAFRLDSDYLARIS